MTTVKSKYYTHITVSINKINFYLNIKKKLYNVYLRKIF